MILHGVVAYLAGLWLGSFLSLFPLSLLWALLSFGLFLTWLEQRGSLSRWGGIFLFAVVVAGMGHAHWAAMSKIESPLLNLVTEQPVKHSGSHCCAGSPYTRWCDSARGGETPHIPWKSHNPFMGGFASRGDSPMRLWCMGIMMTCDGTIAGTVRDAQSWWISLWQLSEAKRYSGCGDGVWTHRLLTRLRFRNRRLPYGESVIGLIRSMASKPFITLPPGVCRNPP